MDNKEQILSTIHTLTARKFRHKFQHVTVLKSNFNNKIANKVRQRRYLKKSKQNTDCMPKINRIISALGLNIRLGNPLRRFSQETVIQSFTFRNSSSFCFRKGTSTREYEHFAEVQGMST
jgi:hypothetical protein